MQITEVEFERKTIDGPIVFTIHVGDQVLMDRRSVVHGWVDVCKLSAGRIFCKHPTYNGTISVRESEVIAVRSRYVT